MDQAMMLVRDIVGILGREHRVCIRRVDDPGELATLVCDYGIPAIPGMYAIDIDTMRATRIS